MADPADERPRPPGGGSHWADSWHLDFALPDGSLGGFLHLSCWPAARRAWWWAHLCTPDGLVAVRDHEVPLPRAGLEVRADGLWGEMVCETPLEHWSYGLEAFGVRYDDPAEALRSEWGERIAVGLDLEWELTGPPVPGPLPGPGASAGGHLQPGAVRGQVLVGPDVLAFEGSGVRSRRWGLAPWWAGPSRRWLGAVTPAGALVAFATEGDVGILKESETLEGLPERATYLVDGRPLDCDILGVAPLSVTAPDLRPARLVRSMVRVHGAGDSTVGWLEWLGR